MKPSTSLEPSAVPSLRPVVVPTRAPTPVPTRAPTLVPTPAPTPTNPTLPPFTLPPFALFPSCNICPGQVQNPDGIINPPLTCALAQLFGQIGLIDPDTCRNIRGPQGQGIRLNRICCLPFIPQDGRCCGECRSGGNPCGRDLTCVNGSCVPLLPGQICNENYNGGNGQGRPFTPPGNNPNPNDLLGLTFCANPNQGGASPPLCGTLNPYRQANGQNSVFCCDENVDRYTTGGPTCANNCPCGETILGEPCGTIFAPPEDPGILRPFLGQCPA